MHGKKLDTRKYRKMQMFFKSALWVKALQESTIKIYDQNPWTTPVKGFIFGNGSLLKK